MRPSFTPSTWTSNPQNKVGLVKKVLSHLSLLVRKEQLEILINNFKPSSKTSVLDVGMAPIEDMVDANYFEKYYPFPQKITAVSVEDCSGIIKNYPDIRFIQVKPHERLPFKNNQFEIVTSWATLEHVGDYKKQKFFLDELIRVGKRVFITTPYRGCFYEPHTGFIFIHWLPLDLFRSILRRTGKLFWASAANLNPLFVRDIKRLTQKPTQIKIYKTLTLIPSHLIITN